MITVFEKNLLPQSSGYPEDGGNQHHVPEDHNLDTHCQENLKPHTILFIYTSGPLPC
jgi:hypothetical protein